jgi:hypothetical protein
MTATQQPRFVSSDSLKLFLCGDVMIGRGIDQTLPYRSEPQLYEKYVRSALEHVQPSPIQEGFSIEAKHASPPSRSGRRKTWRGLTARICGIA